MANYIVGGGFSALALKSLLPDSIVISPALEANSLALEGCCRRKRLEINKAFGRKASSFGALAYSGVAKLHDRSILGGNSGLWGGFVDASKVEPVSRFCLEAMGIKFSEINRKRTGSRSFNKYYCQLQDQNGRILDAARMLQVDIDARLNQVSEDGLLFLVGNKKTTSIQVLKGDIVYLAVGVVQILDLLFRSEKIYENDVVELDEFRMSLHFRIINKVKERVSSCESEIDYYPSGIVSHALGIQRNLIWLDFLNGFGLGMTQRFHQSIQTAKFRVKDGKLQSESHAGGFGQSIHYCNMRINNIPIEEFIRGFWPFLRIVGMAAVAQYAPGPISNDILNCALRAVRCHEK